MPKKFFSAIMKIEKIDRPYHTKLYLVFEIIEKGNLFMNIQNSM